VEVPLSNLSRLTLRDPEKSLVGEGKVGEGEGEVGVDQGRTLSASKGLGGEKEGWNLL